ncbi:hypothetical protein Ahy_B04g070692 isoform N [Arachis hypogaea]|uniref:Replication protein A 70 kDa DNA-binding subunit B/D first OB fold domain-containing protein n=1 Tax=Arachis hypogaea TaxID=3818 RepID=A0A444ZIF8_ARAHY|nr:hypothetical protein Ahy_B04g070692 isoform N [Arachis hypogaea]
MFDDAVGEEKVFKVEIDSAVDPDYSSCFKIVNVFSHNPKSVVADDYINHHKIQATFEDDFIATFFYQLKEGEVFIISDFKVIPNRGLVRVTRHRFRIIFKCSTSVVAAISTVIPNPGLSVTYMDQILQKCVDYEYLIDFVRVLCGLKKRRDVECNGKILKVLTLEVFADGKKISCNFVGACPALIDMNTLKRYQRPPVVILQSFKIKVNGDKFSLQNVINISRVLINPDIYGIASHHFSRLRSNEVGDLVCVIDDESFD